MEQFMTALIMIGIVVGLIFIAAVAMAMNKHAAEKYGFEPFAIPNLLFAAAAMGLLVIGALVIDTTPGSILGIGSNALVLFAASAIVYLGYTAYLIKRTTIMIGLLASGLQVVGLVGLLVLAVAIFVGRRFLGFLRSYLR